MAAKKSTCAKEGFLKKAEVYIFKSKEPVLDIPCTVALFEENPWQNMAAKKSTCASEGYLKKVGKFAGGHIFLYALIWELLRNPASLGPNLQGLQNPESLNLQGFETLQV